MSRKVKEREGEERDKSLDLNLVVSFVWVVNLERAPLLLLSHGQVLERDHAKGLLVLRLLEVEHHVVFQDEPSLLPRLPST